MDGAFLLRIPSSCHCEESRYNRDDASTFFFKTVVIASAARQSSLLLQKKYYETILGLHDLIESSNPLWNDLFI